MQCLSTVNAKRSRKYTIADDLEAPDLKAWPMVLIKNCYYPTMSMVGGPSGTASFFSVL